MAIGTSSNNALLPVLRRLGMLAAAGIACCGCGSESSSNSAPEVADGGTIEGSTVEAQPRGPQCASLECATDVDCCQGEPRACDGTCTDGACTFNCGADTFCPAAIPVCDDGSCVQCTSDTDCSGSNVCADAVCLLPCQSHGDCLTFNACVEGVCVPNRCGDDRDCQMITGNQQAVCSAGGSCEASCSEDSDCVGLDLLLDSAVCVEGNCVISGCSSDQQCLDAYVALNPDLQYEAELVRCLDSTE
jgi:hypothetical protein